MNFFNLKIVTFDKVLIDEQASYCAVFTRSGKMGFEARHEAFVSVLKDNSRIEYKSKSGKNGLLEIKNGLFEFSDNSCTVTVFIGN